MSEDKNENVGCLKTILYLCAGVFVVVIFFSAINGILETLNKIPWYIYIILLVGFWYLIAKVFD